MKKKNSFLYLILGIALAVCTVIYLGMVGINAAVFLSLAVIFGLGSLAFFLAWKETKDEPKLKTDNNQSNSYNSFKENRMDKIWDQLKDFDLSVRKYLPDLPLDEYVVPLNLFKKLETETKNGKPTTNTLQTILMDMEKHVGLNNNKSIITLERVSDDMAGYIEKHDYSFNDITVGVNDVYGANNYISILAHELSHAYQYSKNMNNLYSGTKAELFTDFLTFYLGFGKYTESGKTASKTLYSSGKGKNRTDTIKTATLGYLGSANFKDCVLLVKTLSADKKQKIDNDRKNNNLIKEIKTLKDTVPIYYESICIKLNDIKNISVGEDKLSKIQELYLKYDDSFIDRINSTINDYKEASLDKNTKNLTFIKSIMTELLNDGNFLDSLKTT